LSKRCHDRDPFLVQFCPLKEEGEEGGKLVKASPPLGLFLSVLNQNFGEGRLFDEKEGFLFPPFNTVLHPYKTTNSLKFS
jgi:hypothetical protein